MTKVNCPECKRNTKTNVTNGYCQCRGCKQILIIEDTKAIKCIPKDLHSTFPH